MVGRSYIKSEQEIWGLRENVWKERWRVWGRNNRRQATWRDAGDQGGDLVVMLPEEKGMASDRKGLVQCGAVCPPQLQIGCLCYPKVENVSSSVVSDSVTPWTAVRLLFMEFSRQEYWSGLPFPSPGDLPRDQAQVSHIACRFFTIWATREAPNIKPLAKAATGSSWVHGALKRSE